MPKKRKVSLSQMSPAAPRGKRSGRLRSHGGQELRKVRREREGKKGAKRSRPKSHKAPLPPSKVLALIVPHFESVYRQLNEQLRLIAKLQDQVNRLIEHARSAEH